MFKGSTALEFSRGLCLTCDSCGCLLKVDGAIFSGSKKEVEAAASAAGWRIVGDDETVVCLDCLKGKAA